MLYNTVSKQYARIYNFIIMSPWTQAKSLIYQGWPTLPSSGPSRWLVSLWWLVGVVTSAVYSGNLVAMLSVSMNKLPINSLEELADRPDYSLGLQRGVAYLRYAAFGEHGGNRPYSFCPAGCCQGGLNHTGALSSVPCQSPVKWNDVTFFFNVPTGIMRHCNRICSSTEFHS